MEKIDKSITYVFTKRVELQEAELNTPKEFEYSYSLVKNLSSNARYIEATKPSSSSFLLKLIDKLLNKITKVSFNTKSYINIKNFQILKTTDILITTNHGISSSILFLVIYTRFFNKKLKLFLINSGFFNVPQNQKYIRFLRHLIVKLYLKTHTKIFFTSLSEYEYAIKNFPTYSTKFFYHSFCLDNNFWSKSSTNENPLNISKYILFVGNNGFRDVEMLINIAKSLTDYEFVFITNLINQTGINDFKNIRLVNGEIMKKALTDIDLKKIYEDAAITINPVKNSLVASGQSVTMQSMSVGTPVIISKTIGFWDNFNFRDYENIYFVEEENLNKWLDKINSVLSDSTDLARVGTNAKHLILNKFQQSEFDKFLHGHIVN